MREPRAVSEDWADEHTLLRRLTVDEYDRMRACGILQSGEPYELLDGFIARKIPSEPAFASSDAAIAPQPFFKLARERVAQFRRGRTRQSDAEFLASMLIALHAADAQLAVAVRRVIGDLGLIDPQFILASDTYPGQLAMLPLGENLNCKEFIVRIGETLGKRLPDPNSIMPTMTSRISVMEVVQVIRQQASY